MRRTLILIPLLVLLLAACAGTETAPDATAGPENVATVTATPPPPPASAHDITLWLAPRFAPDPDTAAGALLAERLQAFEAGHPALVIRVRIKDEEGNAGLVQTLTAASEAAPGALPDLLSLNPGGLNTTSLKGLIVPLEDLLPQPTSPAWYEHSLGAALVDGVFYGFPFASNAEALAYRLDLYETPPTSWADVIDGPAPFLFPAGDPAARFTIAQYLALGGSLRDETGRPALDPAILSEVLAFYASARNSGVLPLSARQYTSAQETWRALHDGRAASAIAPFDQLLIQRDPENTSGIPLPTRDGKGIAFSQTWSWAVVTQDPTRQALAADLILWLNSPEFLGPWTEALGLLPPTSDALAAWSEAKAAGITSGMVTVTQAGPGTETLNIFGPAISAAVEAVLSGGMAPEQAALQAAQSLQSAP